MIRWITGPEMRKCKVRGQRTREWEIRPDGQHRGTRCTPRGEQLIREEFSCNHAGERTRSHDEWEVKEEVGIQPTAL